MTTHHILVENIKCGGCINSIQSALMKLDGVTSVDILKEEDKVSVHGMLIDKDTVVATLSSLGYPEKGHNDVKSKALSYVSCMVGKYTSSK